MERTGREEGSLLVSCPAVMYTNRVFRTAKCVLLIEVPS